MGNRILMLGYNLFINWAWIPFCGVGIKSDQKSVGYPHHSHATVVPVGVCFILLNYIS